MALYHRNFLEMKDVTAEELRTILRAAAELKKLQKAGKPHKVLEGKALAMIFEKHSTRTRVSFETGMYQLGGHALYLSSDMIQMGRGESVEDTAKVLSRMVDCILARTNSHATITELAKYSSVPVINALSDFEHPCQILADLLTVQEEKGRLEGLKLAYIGDGNNVANSLLQGCVKAGMRIALACPEGFWPDATILKHAEKEGDVKVVGSPAEAAKDADVLYTDVWVSMGQEEETQKRAKAFAGFQINEELVKKAKPDCIVLHDLPAHYGEEITKDVAYGKQSRIFQQAENRLHGQKGLLALLLNQEFEASMRASVKN